MNEKHYLKVKNKKAEKQQKLKEVQRTGTLIGTITLSCNFQLTV